MPYTYICGQFPGMESCPGRFTTAGERELWEVVELHGRVAHGEDPSQWSEEDRDQIRRIISASSDG